MRSIKDKVEGSLTLEFSETARRFRKEGKRIISLGLGEPTFETPKPIVEKTIDALNSGYTRYSSSLGIIELRKKIVEKLQKENNIICEEKNIAITAGAKQALFLALTTILEPHDEIINITPCYVSYVPQIKLIQPTAKVINIDLEKETLDVDIEKIKECVSNKTKAIIINSPHNPTGKVFTREELEKVCEIAKENDCFIISDEVYEHYLFGEQKHVSIAAIQGMNDYTITTNSLSKTFNMTGWRIGYVIAPENVIRSIGKIQQQINTNTCTFIQKGACIAFDLSTEFLGEYNDKMRKNARVITEMVKENESLHLVPPQGSMFAFLNVKKTGLHSDEFATKLLLEKNVAATPGIAFGKNWDDHIRISLAVENDLFKEGMILINEFVRGLQ